MTDEEEHQLRAFAERLGHVFDDLSLLRDALTHRSFANERPKLAPRDNERLEFLGDAVLGHIAAALLFEAFPVAPEGELTRRRSQLVCAQGLFTLALELGVGQVLRLGQGEERSGGREKPRLLASALEACLAAVYLDGGTAAVSTVVRQLLSPRIQDQSGPRIDYKSRLQEVVQKRGGQAPTYHLVRTDGPEHDRTFVAQVHVDNAPAGEGSGRSKAAAEQKAAEAALIASGPLEIE